jgi:hypothetical protein
MSILFFEIIIYKNKIMKKEHFTEKKIYENLTQKF